jgi:ribulose-phosphate 3-epimerase
MTVRLAPSILSADFAHLAAGIAAVVRAVRRITALPLDVHLMVTDPDRYLEAFAEAGANGLTVHVEVLPHLNRTLDAIRRLGCRAGAAINPSTPLAAIEEVLGQLDLVLVMSVNPGFGGQSFLPGSESKIQRVRALLDRAGSRADVEVDGGVDVANVARVVTSGANVIVAGAAIFGTPNPEQAARELRALAHEAAGAAGRR